MIRKMEKGTPEVSSTMPTVALKSNFYLSAMHMHQSRMMRQNYHKLQTFQILNNINYCIKQCCGTREVHSAHTAFISWLMRVSCCHLPSYTPHFTSQSIQHCGRQTNLNISIQH